MFQSRAGEFFLMLALQFNRSSGSQSHLLLEKWDFPGFVLKWISVSFQTDGFLKDNNNAAQRLLDGMNFMAQSVSELSLGPTKAVTSWLTDQIAPAYWRPNSQILVNGSCCRDKCCIAKTPFPHALSNIVFCRFQMLLVLFQQVLLLRFWENWNAFSSSHSWLGQRKYEQRFCPPLLKRLFPPYFLRPPLPAVS